MTDETTIQPVYKEVTVRSPIDRAFQIFTEEIGGWWPLETHSVAGEHAVTAVFEQRAGGRIFERTAQGQTHTWGNVLVWEPPRRVVFSWYPGREADTAQEVEVSFTPVDSGTRVQLVHRGWEHLGEQAASTRDRYESGWDPVLHRCFQEAAGGAAAEKATGPAAL